MTASASPAATGPVTRYRWVICALLFIAIGINYIDRQMIGILKPTLQGELQWTEIDYANIVFWFQCFYAVGFLTFGRVIDAVGVRIGYAVAFTIWTIASIGHGLIHSITQFAIARSVLGFGEAGAFPASLKAVSEWFPQKERAQAVGIFNAGTAMGPIITPLLVPAITLAFGWRAAFIAIGIITALWLVAWVIMYRRPQEHPKVSPAELAHIQSDDTSATEAAAPTAKISWFKLLTFRQTWAYALGKFLTDPIWWLYLFWLPDFLHKRHGLDLKTFGPPLIAIYLLADFGSIFGGWASSKQLKAGRTPNAARKSTMLMCALLVTPIVAAQFVDSLWAAVAIIGLAAASHQAWSANLMTLPSDLFPKQAVASVIGIGGMAGAIGGMLMTTYNGYILELFKSYQPIFIVAGSAYLVAILVIHTLTPKLEKVAEEKILKAKTDA
ncbi:MFS transporter [Asticcacaulis excentricus]|uniref:Major facilitator superfamily MFS_1 n=1 Tax=Asticcacaulis excentricus (strain ATCC 15261 / DSM 4724 / KCTC 12464 / NCIMB 9791 / VKM B-1370 / CB 48) TaxID=573065 RepID=E8RVL2_ASTEC|nr:MFS transporter [Asticcacaulis excentricus]ADU15181.1 major facilitator superfamily MFS_1 [Asticcacaulis excentricus CB 48]